MSNSHALRRGLTLSGLRFLKPDLPDKFQTLVLAQGCVCGFLPIGAVLYKDFGPTAYESIMSVGFLVLTLAMANLRGRQLDGYRYLAAGLTIGVMLGVAFGNAPPMLYAILSGVRVAIYLALLEYPRAGA